MSSRLRLCSLAPRSSIDSRDSDRDIQESKQRECPTHGKKQHAQYCKINPNPGHRAARCCLNGRIEPLVNPLLALRIGSKPEAIDKFEQAVLHREFQCTTLGLSLAGTELGHRLKTPNLSPVSTFGFVLEMARP